MPYHIEPLLLSPLFAENPMPSVKTFWEERAGDQSLDEAQVTHPDIWQRWLEIEATKPFLRRSDQAIDIGCGSGYATKRFASLVSTIRGVDFSQKMIDRARSEGDQARNCTFDICDVLKLSSDTFGYFDLVITLRCLINLQGWEAQKIALANIASIIKPGGRYIFVEGCRDGREGLNISRVSVGLDTMPPVWHNVDFERDRTINLLSQYFIIHQELDFGVYDLISRVVHPLMVAPENPRYDAKINEIAARVAYHVQGCAHLSRVLFLVLERRF